MQTVKFSRVDKQQFFATLRQRVNEYFVDNQLRKTGNISSYVKAIFMFSLYYLPFLLMGFGLISGWGVIGAYAIMGLGKAGVGLCVMHDANHGSFSRYKWINNIMSYSMNLLGGSSFTWKVQHNLMHHSFTNIYHLDEDIDDKPFLRLSPFGKKKAYHKFQHLYALFIYSLATVSWLGVKDFKQLFNYNKKGITADQGYKAWKVSTIMISTKIMYFSLFIAIPMIFFAKWYIVLLGFLVMHLVAGFIITVIFQLAHVVEGAEHFTTNEDMKMENTWAIHQISTTANFATKNKMLTWLVGGLNHQIEHHLFPNISHIHYPRISKIVKQTVSEFDLPYNEFRHMSTALVSHLKMLKQIGGAA